MTFRDSPWHSCGILGDRCDKGALCGKETLQRTCHGLPARQWNILAVAGLDAQSQEVSARRKSRTEPVTVCALAVPACPELTQSRRINATNAASPLNSFTITEEQRWHCRKRCKCATRPTHTSFEPPRSPVYSLASGENAATAPPNTVSAELQT